MIDKKKFIRYDLDSKSDVITAKINPQEREMLNSCKVILCQKKDSTALKQLAYLGSKVLLDGLTGAIIDTVFKNKQKNKRTGADVEFD